MFATKLVLSRQLFVQQRLVARALLKRKAPSVMMACLSTQTWKTPHRFEEGETYDVDVYDHRSVLESRTTQHFEVNKYGEVDEYDKIMQSSRHATHVESAGSTTTHQPRSITVEEGGDVDDYDHRSIQYLREQHIMNNEDIAANKDLTATQGEIDDFDHRALQSAPAIREGETAEQGDVDEYDHRALYDAAELAEKTPPSAMDEPTDTDDYDRRSKWALGNLTAKDIQEEKDARIKKKTEKLASQRKEAEIRHHAWE